VASVYNLDWPSSAGLSASAQQAQLRALLDRAASLNLNAILLQVRPAADALYASEIEPWSQFLTGRQGVSPGYDPLQFAIKEAHARGLDCTRGSIPSAPLSAPAPNSPRITLAARIPIGCGVSVRSSGSIPESPRRASTCSASFSMSSAATTSMASTSTTTFIRIRSSAATRGFPTTRHGSGTAQ
jgi:hypothetical protein